MAEDLKSIPESQSAAEGRYRIRIAGNCMGASIPEGSVLVADPSVQISPGELCVLTFQDINGPWPNSIKMDQIGPGGATDAFHQVNKVALVFLARYGDTYLLGQIQPPAVSIVNANEIAVLHGIIGGAAETFTIPAAMDRDAWSRISLFAGKEAIEPIGPDQVGVPHLAANNGQYSSQNAEGSTTIGA